MTTLGYGALTRQRQLAQPTTSSSSGAPGVRGYVDSVAALVPAEVLGLHAIVVGLTTATIHRADGTAVTTVLDQSTLRLSFWALVAVSGALYAVGHSGGPWHRGDLVRVVIPPTAAVLWMMLQAGSAFDAVAPTWSQSSRITAATFGAIILGLIAGQLSRTADAVGATGEAPLPRSASSRVPDLVGPQAR